MKIVNTKVHLWLLVLAACAVAPALACGDGPEPAPLPTRPESDAGASAPDAGEAVVADEVEIVKGVPDRGRDPAVVAVDIGGTGLCTGTLISERVVLTARHCVADTRAEIVCPATKAQVGRAFDPRSLSILVGDDAERAQVVAHGLDVVAPGGVTLCDADIALIVTDRAIKGIKPLGVRRTGPAVGETVRAVGYGRPSDRSAPGVKLLRDHVRVLSVSAAEFRVGEATCQGDSGGPAIDQDSGEVIGVVSRGGPRCQGADVHNVYTRVDAFYWLVEEALRRAGEAKVGDAGDAGADAAAPPATTGGKSKPENDVGAPCTSGADCAAGVCVSVGTSAYCSRPCGAGDRCPTNFHCQKTTDQKQVCVRVR
ncbi:MAG: S1 family peptidase [Myxococcales bacterium]|jgi:hypothetical protein|nr:S1 family peptidase [Myxococcales bacterium]